MDKTNAFYVQESDEIRRAAEYIKSLESATKTFRASLKQRKTATKLSVPADDDDEDDDDGMIDDIIQSVFTENQNTTLKQDNDTLSKKGRLARGDVRSIFSNLTNPMRASSSGVIAASSLKLDVDWNKDKKIETVLTPPADYSDNEDTLLEPRLLRNSKTDNQANRVFAMNQSINHKHHSLTDNKYLPRSSFVVTNSPNGTKNPVFNPAFNQQHQSKKDSIISKSSKKEINSDLKTVKSLKPNGSYNFEVQQNGLSGVGNDGMDGRMDGRLDERMDGKNDRRMETRIEHLGRCDINLLKVFAETEIRTVFREQGDIKFNKMNTKRKSKDSGLFGVSLESLLAKDSKKIPSLRAPFFLILLISKLENHVNEEGILRIPGNQARIKETVYNLETCDNPLPLLQSLLPHDLAGLFKHFFRTLPQPIFTLKHLDAFCKALVIQDAAIKLHAFQTLICLLPDVYRASVQLLMGLLQRVSNNDNNRMTLETVSMVISPSLFALPPLSSTASSFSSEIEHLGQFNGVILYLLRNHDTVWNVPPLFLKQIREVGFKASNRNKKLRNKKAENDLERVYIHSLHADQSQKSFQINQSTTVSDLLHSFNNFSFVRFEKTACLFENGGILDQRLLLPHEHISAVLQQNPQTRLSYCLQSPNSLSTHLPPELYP